MKKTYQSPSVKVKLMETIEMICASNEQQEEITSLIGDVDGDGDGKIDGDDIGWGGGGDGTGDSAPRARQNGVWSSWEE